MNQRNLTEIKWSKEDDLKEEQVEVNNKSKQDNDTCNGLQIRCDSTVSVIAKNVEMFHQRTHIHSYLWPWEVAVFVDGEYRCSAILLEYNWLMSSSECLVNVT